MRDENTQTQATNGRVRFLSTLLKQLPFPRKIHTCSGESAPDHEKSNRSFSSSTKEPFWSHMPSEGFNTFQMGQRKKTSTPICRVKTPEISYMSKHGTAVSQRNATKSRHYIRHCKVSGWLVWLSLLTRVRFRMKSVAPSKGHVPSSSTSKYFVST